MPLPLLLGNPFTHLSWLKVAPTLAREFTVVATDLRGYGDSEKPPGGEDHSGYSFRAMAQDQVEAMAINKQWATFSWHWFFNIQPEPLPEKMMGADPDWFIEKKLAKTKQGLSFFDPAALAEYKRCFRNPATIHAICEDYRAGAGIDLKHDEQDMAAGRRIECPLLLWGATGGVGPNHNPGPAEIWTTYAANIVGAKAMPSGHYLMDEAPQETAAALREFFVAA